MRWNGVGRVAPRAAVFRRRDARKGKGLHRLKGSLCPGKKRARHTFADKTRRKHDRYAT